MTTTRLEIGVTTQQQWESRMCGCTNNTAASGLLLSRDDMVTGTGATAADLATELQSLSLDLSRKQGDVDQKLTIKERLDKANNVIK